MMLNEHTNRFFLAAIVSTSLIGCGGEPSAPPALPVEGVPPIAAGDDDEGFSLKIPGIVNVETGEDGVSVKTPVADVDANEERAKVEALGAEIETE